MGTFKCMWWSGSSDFCFERGRSKEFRQRNSTREGAKEVQSQDTRSRREPSSY